MLEWVRQSEKMWVFFCIKLFIFVNDLPVWFQLQDILKFGVEKLLSDDTPDEDIEFSRILGPTVNGEWQTTEDTGIIQDAEVIVSIFNKTKVFC